MVVKNGGLMGFNQQTSVILMGCTRPGNDCYIVIEHIPHKKADLYLFKMVIFYSYVSLPEGNPLPAGLPQVITLPNFCACLRVSRKSRPAKKSTRNGMVVSNPLKNMKVNWDDYSQLNGKS